MARTEPQPPEIGTLWAWVIVEGGTERVASLEVRNVPTPLVFATEAVARRYVPQVRKAAIRTGVPARLVRFARAEVVAEAAPE